MVPSGVKLTTAEYLVHIEDSSTALLCLSDGATDTPVHACPGWTLTQVLHHIGAVYTTIAVLVRERPVAGGTVRDRIGPVPPPEQVDTWFRTATDAMVAEFSAAAPDERAWSWSTNQTVGFRARRMCHEVVVHHWDAAVARNVPLTIATELAADGVDEFLTEFVPLMRRRSTVPANGERYVFECVDTAARWELRLDADGPTVTYDGLPEEDAATVVRAGAAELLLMLWRRLPPSTVAASDHSGIDRWFTLVGCP